MKKLLISLTAGLVISLLGMLINYRSYLKRGYLKLCITNHGGEITIQDGFGLRCVHIYAMEMGQSGSQSLRFAPVNLLVHILVIALIVYLIITVIEKVRH